MAKRIQSWVLKGGLCTCALLCRNQGLIPRALHYIINGMGTFDFKSRFDTNEEKVTLEMSFLEDYQNCIYDLLSPTIRVGQSKPMLNARSDANGFLHIINLTVFIAFYFLLSRKSKSLR